jgi:hypothetical protein
MAAAQAMAVIKWSFMKGEGSFVSCDCDWQVQ